MIILFKVKFGSKVYGTDNTNSDDDIKFVYLQTPYDLFEDGYKPQLQIDKDNNGYELNEFMKLLENSNPTAIEILNTPNEFVIEKHQLFDLLLNKKDLFLTKKLYKSFTSFAQEQIRKARNTDNRFNMEYNEVKRLTPIDFCYVVIDQDRDGLENKQGVLPIQKFFEIHNKTQFDFIVNKYEHSKELHGLYLSKNSKGICDENSTALKLSSSDKGDKPFANLVYNEDGYRSHCKKYKEYTDWLAKRNPQRFIDIQNTNQKIDTKNAYHTVRLLNMCYEIFTDGNVNVDRRNFDAEYLKQIRKGEFDLETLLTKCENTIHNLSELEKHSCLPDSVDLDKTFELLKTIKRHYHVYYSHI